MRIVRKTKVWICVHVVEKSEVWFLRYERYRTFDILVQKLFKYRQTWNIGIDTYKLLLVYYILSKEYSSNVLNIANAVLTTLELPEIVKNLKSSCVWLPMASRYASQKVVILYDYIFHCSSMVCLIKRLLFWKKVYGRTKQGFVSVILEVVYYYMG